MKSGVGALAVLLAGTSVIACSAAAQTVAPAPIRQSVDSNGVDLFLGTLNVSRTDISVGDDKSGMTYSQIWRNSAWVDNYDIHLVNTSGTITVTNGGSAESFTPAGNGSFSSAQGTASSLSQSGSTYTYITGDGARYQFDTTRSYAALSAGDAARVTSITRPDGVALTFAYSTDVFCTRSKPGSSGDICTQHTQTGRLMSITSNLGYRADYIYRNDDTDDPTLINSYYTLNSVTITNLANNATRSASYNGGITDMAGRAWNYQYSANGITDIQRPGRGFDIHIDYANGKVSAYRNAANITTQYSYTDDGASNERRVQIQIGGNTPSQVAFDLTSGLMKRSTDENGNTTSYEHNDPYGRLTKVAAPEGNSVVYTYDSRGNVTQTTAHRKSYDTAGDVTTWAGFEGGCSNTKTCNEPQWTKDALGNQTDYTYDGNTGLITSINRPADVNGTRPYIAFEYTSLASSYGAGGGITRLQRVKTCQSGGWGCTDGRLVGTFNEYNDATGNFTLARVTSGAHNGSLNAVTAYGYDDIRNVISVTDPKGNSSHINYDSARRPLLSVAPDPDGAGGARGKASATVYNADGTVQLQQVGTANADGTGFYEYFRTSYGYDSAGRTQSAILSRGNSTFSVTQYSYDGLGRPDCVAVRMNPAAFGSLPGVCDLSTTGADGPDRISRNEYDAGGRVTRSWSGYRTANAAHTDTEWLGNGTLFRVYNPVQDAGQRGPATTYNYDGLDRRTFTCFNTTTCTGSDYEQLSYDAKGNVTSRRMRDGNTTSYTYDNLGRMTKLTPPGVSWEDSAITYAYDNLDHPLQAIDTGHGHSAIFTYDALGRVIQENGPWSQVTFGYDLNGNRTVINYGDGFSVNYDYDAANRMTAVTDHNTNGQSTVLARYYYDEMNHVGSIGRANGSNSYYGFTDANNSPVPYLAAMTHDFAGTNYDLSTAYTYSQAGQITRKDSSNGAYDWSTGVSVARGYATNALNQYTSSGGVSLGYDARGNLTSSGSTGYAYTGRDLMFTAGGNSFFYDALGRLDIDYKANQNLLYAGSQLLRVNNGSSGALLERYVYGLGEAPIVSYDGNNTRRWLYPDERGTVIAVADDAGNGQYINHYDEFGIPAGNNYGRFGYTGQQWLPSAGLSYYKARMYSPTLGRFMQTDPIGYADGVNWYNYVGGDPINGTDPSGLKSKVPTITMTPTGAGNYNWSSSDGNSGSYNGNADTATVNGVSGYYGSVSGWVGSSGLIGGAALGGGLSGVNGIGSQSGSGTNVVSTEADPEGANGQGVVVTHINTDNSENGLPPTFSNTTIISPQTLSDNSALQSRRGERGYAGSNKGTGNPDKHMKPIPGKPGFGQIKDPQTGKLSGPKPWPNDPRLGPQSSNYEALFALGGGLLVVGGLVFAPEITVPGLIIGGLVSR